MEKGLGKLLLQGVLLGTTICIAAPFALIGFLAGPIWYGLVFGVFKFQDLLDWGCDYKLNTNPLDLGK